MGDKKILVFISLDSSSLKEKLHYKLIVEAAKACYSNFVVPKNITNITIEEFIGFSAKKLNPPKNHNDEIVIDAEYLKNLLEDLFEIKRCLTKKDKIKFLSPKLALKLPLAKNMQDLMQKVISLEYDLKEKFIEPNQIINRIKEIQTLLDPTMKWLGARGDGGGGGNAGSGMMARSNNDTIISEADNRAFQETQEHPYRHLKKDENKGTISIPSINETMVVVKSSECPKNLLGNLSKILGISLQAVYMEDTKTINQKTAELTELISDEEGNITEVKHKIKDNLPPKFEHIVKYIKDLEKKKKKEDYDLEF